MIMMMMTTIMAFCLLPSEANASEVLIEDVTMTYRPSDAKALPKDHRATEQGHILVEVFGGEFWPGGFPKKSGGSCFFFSGVDMDTLPIPCMYGIFTYMNGWFLWLIRR